MIRRLLAAGAAAVHTPVLAAVAAAGVVGGAPGAAAGQSVGRRWEAFATGPAMGPDQETVPNPLVLIEGVPVFPDDVGWQLTGLNPFMIDRVEVVRDLSSAAIYGDRAVCGIVNVLTRRR